MSKLIFSAAVFLLLISGLTMITNHQGFSQRLLVICFWLLLAGLILYFYETIYKK